MKGAIIACPEAIWKKQNATSFGGFLRSVGILGISPSAGTLNDLIPCLRLTISSLHSAFALALAPASRKAMLPGLRLLLFLYVFSMPPPAYPPSEPHPLPNNLLPRFPGFPCGPEPTQLEPVLSCLGFLPSPPGCLVWPAPDPARSVVHKPSHSSLGVHGVNGSVWDTSGV